MLRQLLRQNKRNTRRKCAMCPNARFITLNRKQQLALNARRRVKHQNGGTQRLGIKSVNLISNQAIAIPCPNCGNKLSQTIGKLKTNPELTCTKCRTRFKVDATQMRTEIAKVEKALADLQRTLGKFGK